MNYRIKRTVKKDAAELREIVKEVVVDLTGRQNPSLYAVEFVELVMREFPGIPMLIKLFKFDSDPANSNLLIMSLDWEALNLYPVDPPEPAPRVWTIC